MQIETTSKKQLDVLNALYEGQVSSEKALQRLTPKHEFKGFKRARYIKIKMSIPNGSRKLNMFLKTLFAIPIPIGFGKIVVKLMNSKVQKGLMNTKSLEKVDPEKRQEVAEKMWRAENSLNDLDLNELYTYLRYAKNTTIDIDTEDAKIKIKIR